MTEGALYVISGPSGAGKGTLVEKLVERVPRCWVSVSATTRDPRAGEVDGVDYRFYSVEDFEDAIAADGFVEWAQVHSNYYGTPTAPIREHLDSGEAVILEIDVQGGFQVREKFPEANLIFIMPPDMVTLEERLRGRGTDSEETVIKRLENAEDEIAASKDYDVIIVNDDLERSSEELVKVVKSQFGQ